MRRIPQGLKGSLMAEGEIKYEFKTVTVLRGMEPRTIENWGEDRWELVSQVELQLMRTKLEFRRVKPKPPLLLIGVALGVLLILGGLIAVMSILTSGDDKAAPSGAAPTQTAVAPDSYSYAGPEYEVVSTDRGQTSASLAQYWVHSSELDVAADAYRDQVKLIIEDIAHEQGTNQFLVEVVIDEEIALAESPSTYQAFVDEHGSDYATITVPQKEAKGWVASYAGGFDYDTSEASDSAFEIVWWPAGDAEFETWEPNFAS